jgi:hypothetical protein
MDARSQTGSGDTVRMERQNWRRQYFNEMEFRPFIDSFKIDISIVSAVKYNTEIGGDSGAMAPKAHPTLDPIAPTQTYAHPSF